MDQHRRYGLAAGTAAAFKQKGVGAGAPLEAVFHLKSQPFRAQAPQADQAGLQWQHDHPPIGP